ncbi:MAG TPA: PKD domain-containing protein [Chryseosolibacter sp.]
METQKRPMTTLAPGKRIALLLLVSFFTAVLANAQTAQFSADKTSGCFPVTVNFTDASTGGVNSWTWNFGNGNGSSLQNPSAVYTQAGVYTVSLTVSNGVQSDSEVKTGYIVIHGYPTVDFSFDKSSGCSPLQVQFTNSVNQSNGSITSWQWVFGDGGTSTQPNPSYTYHQPGNPTIALRATNVHGCEATQTKISAIIITGPTTSFTPSATSICQVPANIIFTNQSTGTGALTYLWNFGGGATSTQTSPSHTFTQGGSHTVRLTTTDAQGCSSYHEIELTAGTEEGLSFDPMPKQLCIGQLLSTFTVQATHPIQSMTWNFGNGTSSTSPTPAVAYQNPGTYTITLTAQLEGKACQSVVSKNVVVLGTVNPTFNHTLDCDNKLVLKSTTVGAQRIEWIVNGQAISTASQLTYNPPIGNFEVVLRAYNAQGCSNELKKSIPVTVLPNASFNPAREQDCVEPSLSGCAPFKVDFTNTSTAGSAFTSSWSLGEGVTSIAKDPTRTFTNAGTFPIRLSIKDARGCVDTVRSIVRVASSAPTVTFTPDKGQVCSGETVAFLTTVSNADLLCWDFGDGGTATGNNPTYKYTTPGQYHVKVTAKNAGCVTVFQFPTPITVKVPLVDFEIVKSCINPYLVHFIDKSQSADQIRWDLGDGTESTSNDFFHEYSTTGSYTVTLTGTNNTTQCVVPTTKAITIQDIKADFRLESETPCKNNPTPSFDLSEFAAGWTWFVDGQLYTQTRQPLFTFLTSGQHTIRLDATDSDGCTDSKQILINVPNISGHFSTVQNSDCQTLTVNFSDASTGTPPIQSWYWDFGNGSTSTLKDPTEEFVEKDTFDISLRLTNADGACSFVHKGAVTFTIPIVDFSPVKLTHCLNETIRFNNTTVNAKDYLWKFEGGGQSPLFSPTTSYAQAGEYDITLIATDKYGCSLETTKPVHVAQPKADFQAFQTSGECPPLTSIFKSISTGSNLTYQWNFGNGQQSSVKDPACTYTRPGSYDVALSVRDQFGCTDNKLVEDLIQVGGPYGNFEQTTLSVCTQAAVDFIAVTFNTKIHEWDFGDGNVINRSEQEAHHTYLRPGTYNPSLVLIDEKNCKVVADGGQQIIVHDTTAVEFTYAPECIFNGETISLQPSNQDNQTHEWFINGRSFSQGPETNTTIDSAGTFRVELRGTNEFGCVSHHVQEIRIHGKIEMIPNVFTANGDAYNEVFVIPGVENSDWLLRVFNRWGKEIFTQPNYGNTWRADNLAAGTYYYHLNNQVCPNRSYKGYVHVLK